MKIFVNTWFAWQPRTGEAALCRFRKDGQQHKQEIEKPELSNIPAMQRRRLGPLARVVFHALGQCADTSKQDPVIFSSLMGEIQRTQSILTAIASDQPVSPAAFSLSVHNAISGLWSMIHDIKAPMIAISPSNGSPVPALLEAAGILQEKNHTAVNIVLYEEDYPDFYTPFLTGPIAPCALALRLIAPELAGPLSQQLSLRPLKKGESETEAIGPLGLVPLLKGSQPSLDIPEAQAGWRLECRS